MENHVNNYFTLVKAAHYLNYFLRGLYMAEAVRTGAGELQMVFRQRGVNKAVKFYFGEEAFLFFPDKFFTPKKAQPILQALENRQFLKAVTHPHDRSFRMHFSDDFCVVVLLYGRNANLLLYQHNTLIFSFNTNIKTHADKPLTYFLNLKATTQEDFISTAANLGFKKAVSAHFPAFTKLMLNNLGIEKMQNLSGEEQFGKLKEWESVLLNSGLHIYTSEKIPHARQTVLSLLKLDETEVFFTDDIYAALNEYARLYFKNLQFSLQKKRLLHTLKQKIDRAEGQIASYYKHLDELGTSKNYKHQADLLMANLHEIPKGAEKILLTDFDGETKVEIKLKRDLSVQEWAEKLYRKAKKQQIEREQTETHISVVEKMLEELRQKFEKAEAVNDAKELKNILPQETSSAGAKKKPEAVPYKKFEIDGFTVLVGRSAADNDKLTTAIAKKDDTWLHAKDVAGSHVVIQNPSRKEIPKPTLEKAAQLAAYFSKGKGSKLFPVAYTLKKFVRKPKGAGPGKVLVDKETVLIVEPKLPE